MKGHGAAATEENRHFPKCIMGSGVSLEDKQVKCMMEMKHVKNSFPQSRQCLVIFLRLLMNALHFPSLWIVSRKVDSGCLTSVQGLSVNKIGRCVQDE